MRGCKGLAAYTTGDKCEDGARGSQSDEDIGSYAPGHETLMATAIAGSSVMRHAILFVIAAKPTSPAQCSRQKNIL